MGGFDKEGSLLIGHHEPNGLPLVDRQVATVGGSAVGFDNGNVGIVLKACDAGENLLGVEDCGYEETRACKADGDGLFENHVAGARVIFVMIVYRLAGHKDNAATFEDGEGFAVVGLDMGA